MTELLASMPGLNLCCVLFLANSITGGTYVLKAKSCLWSHLEEEECGACMVIPFIYIKVLHSILGGPVRDILDLEPHMFVLPPHTLVEAKHGHISLCIIGSVRY